jgi:uncharacterized protein
MLGNFVNQKEVRPILTEAALLFLTLFLPGVLMDQAGANPDMGGVMAQTILFAVPQTLLMIHVAGLRGDIPAAAFGIVPILPRDVLLSIPVTLILLSLSLLLTRLPAGIVGNGYRWKLDTPWQIPLAFASGLATGYREEFFFRPYLLRRLPRAGIGPAVTVVLSTVLFASCHAYEGAGGVLLACLQGLGFCALFLRVPSLHLLAFAHGLYNAAILVFSLTPWR